MVHNLFCFVVGGAQLCLLRLRGRDESLIAFLLDIGRGYSSLIILVEVMIFSKVQQQFRNNVSRVGE